MSSRLAAGRATSVPRTSYAAGLSTVPQRPTAKPIRRTTKTRPTASRERRPRLASVTGSALPLEAMRLPLEGLRRRRPRTDVLAVNDPVRLAPARLVEDPHRRVRARREGAREDDDMGGKADPADRDLERESERGHGHRADVVPVDARPRRRRHQHLLLVYRQRCHRLRRRDDDD